MAFDADGRTSFGRLQERMHIQDAVAARRLATAVPAVYLIFDVLHLDGRSTLDEPYRRRRELLDSLAPAGASWRTPPFTAAMLADLAARLEPLARGDSPLSHPLSHPPPAADSRGVHWTRPVLVGEVAFGEWTQDGHLRHPSWRGLRPDKFPDPVVRES